MTIQTRRLVAVLLALALSAGPMAVLAAPTQASSIRGIVYEPDFRTPVADLSVQIYAQGGEEPAAAASTDSKGRFRLADVPEGTYLLVLRDDAGEPLAKAEITAIAGRASDIAVALPGAGEGGAAPAASSFLGSPLGATLALVGTAVVVAVVGDELTSDNPEREDLEPPSPDEP